jgi:hypothetical protein
LIASATVSNAAARVLPWLPPLQPATETWFQSSLRDFSMMHANPGLSKFDLKNASVQQPLFMKCCPFLVIPTRISCHIALDTVACAPFSDGKAHEVRQRHQVPQEIRGSEAEGSAVPRTTPGNPE